MVAGDFNRDGKIDLVSTSFQNQRCEFGFCQPVGPPGALAVLLGAGNGTFGGPGVLASGDFALAAVGEFDGDGNSDIVVNGSSSTFSIYLGDGTGGFPEQVGISFGACCGSLTAADLNGDGLEDIVSAVASGVQVQLNTTPGFSLAASASGPPIPAGGSATYTINVGQQNGFSSAVSLTCSSPQLAGIACSVSPSSVTPGGESTLTVTTTGASGALVRGLGYGWLYALWLPLGMVVFGIAERRIGKKNLCGLMLFCLTSLVACGGGSGSTRIPSTPSGSYTINVTGVSGSVQRSATVTLTVQ